MKNYIKKIGAIVLCFAMCISTFCLFTVSSTAAEENAVSKEYPVTDDAWIRADQADNVISDETLKSGNHGVVFADGKTKVINVKYDPNGDPKRNLKALMKYTLPSKAELESFGFDTFELEFYIARIANIYSGPQTYGIYYATGLDWIEETLEDEQGNVIKKGVTWNQVNDQLVQDEEHLIDTFTTEKGYGYMNLSKEDCAVKADVSDLVLSLVEKGETTLTVFVAGLTELNTTLQIHSQNSHDGKYESVITATKVGYSADNLKAFVKESDALITKYCSDESVAAFENALSAAKDVCNDNNASDGAIRDAYKVLMKAKEGLEGSVDYVALQDANIRRNKADTKYNYESKNPYKVINIKYQPNNGNYEFTAMVQLQLPTKADAEKYGYDSYTFSFNKYMSFGGAQDYYFYYQADLDWDETTVTWNNMLSRDDTIIPSSNGTSIPDNESSSFLFIYREARDYNSGNYTNLTTDESRVDVDVTEVIKALVESGAETVTIFGTAKTNQDRSVQFHSKDGDASLAPKLTASYTAKAPVTTNETLKVESGDYDMHYQTRDGVDGTTDYRLLVVANEDYIKTLESAKIQAVFSNGTVSKTLKVEITVAYTTIEAVDEDGNTTIYTAEDGTVIMGCVVKGVPAGYDIVKDSAEFLPVLAAN